MSFISRPNFQIPHQTLSCIEKKGDGDGDRALCPAWLNQYSSNSYKCAYFNQGTIIAEAHYIAFNSIRKRQVELFTTNSVNYSQGQCTKLTVSKGSNENGYKICGLFGCCVVGGFFLVHFLLQRQQVDSGGEGITRICELVSCTKLLLVEGIWEIIGIK